MTERRPTTLEIPASSSELRVEKLPLSLQFDFMYQLTRGEYKRASRSYHQSKLDGATAGEQLVFFDEMVVYNYGSNVLANAVIGETLREKGMFDGDIKKSEFSASFFIKLGGMNVWISHFNGNLTVEEVKRGDYDPTKRYDPSNREGTWYYTIKQPRSLRTSVFDVLTDANDEDDKPGLNMQLSINSLSDEELEHITQKRDNYVENTIQSFRDSMYNKISTVARRIALLGEKMGGTYSFSGNLEEAPASIAYAPSIDDVTIYVNGIYTSLTGKNGEKISPVTIQQLLSLRP